MIVGHLAQPYQPGVDAAAGSGQLNLDVAGGAVDGLDAVRDGRKADGRSHKVGRRHHGTVRHG